ncbi:site-2 protease family protein [Candidatus Fermentibacteria bacterium]|nr:site-2 protease family protein [Candidatus Fermentibacteria bacterium]
MNYWIVSIFILLFSLVCHEAAHAWMAYRKGDATAYLAGRLSLNPLVHLDPVGSVLLPLLGIVTGAPVIGWAKPVPVNPRMLRTPSDYAWVSFAGPGANLLLAVLFTLGYGAVRAVGLGGPLGYSLVVLFSQGVFINLLLAAFNLLPVPPLDGSWIFGHLFPSTVGRLVDTLRPYSMIVLIALVASGILRWVLYPVLSLATVLLRFAGGL